MIVFFLNLDINECQGQNTCDPKSSVCENLEGTYWCNCLPGFIMSSDGKRCIRKYNYIGKISFLRTIAFKSYNRILFCWWCSNQSFSVFEKRSWIFVCNSLFSFICWQKIDRYLSICFLRFWSYICGSRQNWKGILSRRNSHKGFQYISIRGT